MECKWYEKYSRDLDGKCNQSESEKWSKVFDKRLERQTTHVLHWLPHRVERCTPRIKTLSRLQVSQSKWIGRKRKIDTELSGKLQIVPTKLDWSLLQIEVWKMVEKLEKRFNALTKEY